MLSRRQFLKSSALGLSPFAFPGVGFSLQQLNKQEDPHYFISLNFYGGWDHSYMFDARPLAMTGQGLIQNYTGLEPKVYGQGDTGPWLFSHLMDPLSPFMQDLCIIKGVSMATTFDGHPQNMAYIFTGNAFGGDSFLPTINQHGKVKDQRIPLDSIESGTSGIHLTNGERIAKLSRSEIRSLVSQLRTEPIDQTQLDFQFLRGLYQKEGLAHDGGFAKGARLLDRAAERSIDFSNRLSQIKLSDSVPDEGVEGFVDMMNQLFKNKVGYSGIFSDVYDLDSHNVSSARAHPETISRVIEQIVETLRLFKSIRFSKTQSLLDVTTLMITSEFSRTMRIPGMPIHETGTNHNAFNNTVILAGKGIRGGQLIGGTDFQSAGEELSGAHLQIDPVKEKVFGLPFDYQTQKAVLEKPAEFKLDHYLNHKNIVNTLYSLFDVPREHWWTLDRNSAPAPVVSRILD